MKAFKYFFLISVLISSNVLFAQYTEVINSNRPGMSKSAFSVGTNVLQFEVGPNYIKEERTPLPKYEVSGFGADFSVRYGLFFEALEINIEGNYQNDTKTNFSTFNTEDKRSNFKYLTLGAKYLIYDPYKDIESEKPNLYSWKANRGFKWKSLIPAIAVYAGVNYDTENNPYTAAGIEGLSPKIMIATQNNFNGGWVFVMNLIKDRIGTDQSDFTYILTLTHAFSPQWVIFGETQGIKSDFYADNLLRFGGAYLFDKNFQLDTAVTFNTKDTPSVLNLTLGASYRFDFHKDKNINNGNSAEDELERKLRGKGARKEKKRKNINSEKKKEKKRKRKDEDF
ncbi:outer membrane putative beta-barrel porin/alpha-amylase [Jejuia pallidilutea]|uniref:Outer membrane putative beta-barrel porin/alpha-amylase n=1 Tax=Jejuia pallidilutea TaxID=504487 RepID=A0A362X8Q0_9FLAO|nr:transporter [Jejuia pallidilutea]PQV50169.1 outer membrane putative beta-barrel porin/alpha-amylase [Jejuia pallidilutea]